ncbi:MAG: ion transporter [Anaerolineae bacterium]|nr:ion transporter [Anaerolineae bacterium]
MSLTKRQQVQQLSNQRIEVAEIARQASQWRLMDCSDTILEQMHQNLLREMTEVEKQLHEANYHFQLYVEKGRPLETSRKQATIERLSFEWENLDRRLREVDEVLLEHNLRDRLANLLGSTVRVNLLDASVLISILIVVGFTFVELLFNLPEQVITTLYTIDTVICIFLIADFMLRVNLAQDKGWYWRRYWIDLVASIPFYSFLRVGRLVRLTRFMRFSRATHIVSALRLLRLSRAFRLLLFAFRGLDKLTKTFQLNLLKRTIMIAGVLLVFGALSIGALEGAQETSLQEFQESLWWTFTTIVTGGFADLYNPNTASGRLVTVGLVLLGLTVTGIFTASLTSVLVEDDSVRIEQKQRDMQAQLTEISHAMSLLSKKTNEGLIALESIAEDLVHQPSRTAISRVLANAMVENFDALQASVHLLDNKQKKLIRMAYTGMDEITPPDNLAVGSGLIGELAAELLAESDLIALDIEPRNNLCVEVQGISMACPLVAGNRLLGVMHAVMPEDVARFYLYNRVPMTLAHHTAIAILAVDLLAYTDNG